MTFYNDALSRLSELSFASTLNTASTVQLWLLTTTITGNGTPSIILPLVYFISILYQLIIRHSYLISVSRWMMTAEECHSLLMFVLYCTNGPTLHTSYQSWVGPTRSYIWYQVGPSYWYLVLEYLLHSWYSTSSISNLFMANSCQWPRL